MGIEITPMWVHDRNWKDCEAWVQAHKTDPDNLSIYGLEALLEDAFLAGARAQRQLSGANS